jgi:hypothetical protein
MLVRERQEIQKVSRSLGVAEPAALTLEQQLEEIRVQLAWVRDYL